ncbi:MAG: hypothetical protein WCF67_09590 [Chitinophagaceae bacterium]
MESFNGRNIVGQAARDDDFFPRPDIIKLIYRRLDTGRHLHISAPRRVGKTSVLHYLQEHPEEGFEFKYIITQSVSDPDVFFKQVLEALKDFNSISKKTMDSIVEFLEQLKLDVPGVGGFEIKNKEPNYLVNCKCVVKSLSSKNKTLVLMIDEFPQTVENIWRDSNDENAKRFLYANRELQEIASKNIRFIYTGSIGLKPLCARLGALDALNYLTTIEMGTLSVNEATLLCEGVLKRARVTVKPGVISYLLEMIHWLIPFHLQLALQELIDESDRGIDVIDIDSVKNAIDKITYRRNNQYFEHYYNHIVKTFKNQPREYNLARKILDTLSRQDTLTRQEIIACATEQDALDQLNNILTVLQYDGYIYEDASKTPEEFRFTSPLIKIWWKKNML